MEGRQIQGKVHQHLLLSQHHPNNTHTASFNFLLASPLASSEDRSRIPRDFMHNFGSFSLVWRTETRRKELKEEDGTHPNKTPRPTQQHGSLHSKVDVVVAMIENSWQGWAVPAVLACLALIRPPTPSCLGAPVRAQRHLRGRVSQTQRTAKLAAPCGSGYFSAGACVRQLVVTGVAGYGARFAGLPLDRRGDKFRIRNLRSTFSQATDPCPTFPLIGGEAHGETRRAIFP